ncbi:MAG TPA: amidohydrolase family protein [Dehalococcoidia bacterium]
MRAIIRGEERVIIDFHTHIFGPHVRDRREDFARRDSTFAEMYADPRAKIADANDLLASMDAAGVDVSVALGFAWRNDDDIASHNDYLLESAASSSGRIIAFTTVNMASAAAEAEIARCAAAGARGLGELRPDNQGWDLSGSDGDCLAVAAREHGLILLLHVTEDGDHEYPGKRGCSLAAFRDFAHRHADLAIVGAHLGGDAYRCDNPPPAHVDTAAQPFLYRDDEAAAALAAVPAGCLLFGSDYPLISQERALGELRAALTSEERVERAVQGNAEALLGRVSADSPS